MNKLNVPLFNTSNDEIENKRILHFTSTILLVSIIVLTILSIIKTVTPPDINSSDYILWSITVLFVVYYIVLRNGKVSLAGFLYILTIWLSMTFLAWRYEGVRDIAVVSYILTILISIQILKLWQGLSISILSIISLWILYYAEHNQIISPLKEPSLNYSIEFTMILIIVSTIIYLNAKSFLLYYRRVQSELEERINAENALKESTEKYKVLFETMPNGFYRSTPEGYFIDANPAFLKMLGYSSKEELFRVYIPTDIFVCPVEREEIQKGNVTFINNVEEYQLKTKDGRIIYVEDNARYIKDQNGKILFNEGICRDVTERKQAEQELIKAKEKAEESDRLKTSFLHNMSHEIRTPMNAIMGFAELMNIEDMAFDERKKLTKIMRESAHVLLNIINDLLDISRIESNTLKLVKSEGNINSILGEIKVLIETRNQEIYSKPITIKLINELTPEQYLIETDVERIKQVLINLTDNAIKYTLEGSVHIGCNLKDDKNLMFYISDTGIGIPKDKQDLIFEMFRQVDESYLTREFGGTGLGLSICKGIVELMNGSIWVESEPDKGSTFYFTIPYKPINQMSILNEPVKTNVHDFTGKTILIVEDIEYNFELLKMNLAKTKAQLMYAINGTDAIEMFRSHSEIDLVLMDIRLPDINGIDLTKMMKSERNDIKIIAQTAYVTVEEKEKMNNAGCIDFISKPINRTILLDLINKHLK